MGVIRCNKLRQIFELRYPRDLTGEREQDNAQTDFCVRSGSH